MRMALFVVTRFKFMFFKHKFELVFSAWFDEMLVN